VTTTFAKVVVLSTAKSSHFVQEIEFPPCLASPAIVRSMLRYSEGTSACSSSFDTLASPAIQLIAFLYPSSSYDALQRRSFQVLRSSQALRGPLMQDRIAEAISFVAFQAATILKEAFKGCTMLYCSNPQIRLRFSDEKHILFLF
jgi:hypothetical protein